jgi:hypothetical protein
MMENYAQLLIPHARNGDPALEWRFELIWQETLFDTSTLRHGIERRAAGLITPTERKTWLSKALHESLAINEIDRTLLTVASWLHNIEKLDGKASQLVRDAIAKYQTYPSDKCLATLTDKCEAKQSDEYLVDPNDYSTEELNASLRWDGRFLIEDEVPRIRAKLAVQEVIAAIIPELMIPHLVSISPRYLACTVVQSWIVKNQYLSQYGLPKERHAARKAIQIIFSSLRGEGRKKARQLPRWAIWTEHKAIAADISTLREKSKAGKISEADLHKFVERWKIHDDLKTLVLSKTQGNGPKTLALQIMEYNGTIRDVKPFVNFQVTINRLNRERDFRIKSKIAEMLLDLPTCYPELVKSEQHWNILESVALKPMP